MRSLLYNGAAVKDFEQYAFFAFIRDKHTQRVVCGGAVLYDDALVSAAHCCDRNDLFVQIPAKNASYAIADMVVHPQYNPSTYANDVCVLRTRDAMLTAADKHVHVAEFVSGTAVTVMGGGATMFEAAIARPVMLPSTTCRQRWKRFFDDATHVCASGEKNDACAGDSGGPLFGIVGDVVHLYGIVSFGSTSCGKASSSTVYVRLSAYREFITRQARCRCLLAHECVRSNVVPCGCVHGVCPTTCNATRICHTNSIVLEPMRTRDVVSLAARANQTLNQSFASHCRTLGASLPNPIVPHVRLRATNGTIRGWTGPHDALVTLTVDAHDDYVEFASCDAIRAAHHRICCNRFDCRCAAIEGWLFSRCRNGTNL